jgi:hypothetical protein
MSALYPNKHTLDLAQLPWPTGAPAGSIEVLSGPIYERLIWGNFIHPPTVMARRTAISEAGEFDASIVNGTDYDWLLRVCRLGPAVYVNRPLLKYRYSEGQLSSPKHVARIALDAIKAMNKLRERDPDLYRRHRVRFWRRIGRCYLRAANASAELDRLAAAGYLLRSMAHGIFNTTSLRAIGKMILPRSLLQTVRSIPPTPRKAPSSGS